MMPINHIENKYRILLDDLCYFFGKVQSGILIDAGNSVRFLHPLFFIRSGSNSANAFLIKEIKIRLVALD